MIKKRLFWKFQKCFFKFCWFYKRLYKISKNDPNFQKLQNFSILLSMLKFFVAQKTKKLEWCPGERKSAKTTVLLLHTLQKNWANLEDTKMFVVFKKFDHFDKRFILGSLLAFSWKRIRKNYNKGNFLSKWTFNFKCVLGLKNSPKSFFCILQNP